MHWHPSLHLRKLENTSIAGIRAMNKENITAFFDNFRDFRLRFNFTKNIIFNFDESGVSSIAVAKNNCSKRAETSVTGNFD